MIKVLFFAQLAEDAGCGELNIEHQSGMNARSLVDALEAKVGDRAIEQLRHDFVLLSVNQAMADWDSPLADGDEVGFLPPFSGG